MSKMKTIHEKLVHIQSNLKVEKGRTNNFGKYKYRNLEDIFQGLKPLLKETGCVLTVSDEIKEINGFNYICATATLRDDDKACTTTGYAREAVTKKGMDDSQITGATSSYARKYALNGLFAIDDTADADTMDNSDHVAGELSKPQIDKLLELANKADKVDMISDKIDNREINKGNYESSIKRLEGMINGK